MPLIMNASCVTQEVSAFGNHFTMKPGQIKNFTDAIASFMASNRADNGMVMLSDDFLDPSFQTTDEGKRQLAEAKARGVTNRVNKLKQLAYNETVSLKMDLELKNIKSDPRVFMDPKMISQLEELAKYLDSEDTAQAEKVEQIKKLEKRIGKVEKE